MIFTIKQEISHKVCDECSCEAFTPGSNKCGYCGAVHEEAAKIDEVETFQTETRSCRKCGCNDHQACQGGCFWVGLDLCSKCYLRMRTNYIHSHCSDVEKPSIERELIRLLSTDGIDSRALAIEVLENMIHYMEDKANG